jgi:uncharacterized protein
MSWRWPAVWRDERGGWWRVPITLALYGAGVVLGIALYTQANVSGLKEALARQPAQVREIVSHLATVVITGLGLVGCLAGSRFVHHKPAACLFTDGRAFGVGLALRSAALWALLWLACTFAMPSVWENIKERLAEIPLAWWPVVALTLFGAMAMGRTAEEVLFRGYLQPRLGAWFKQPWLAVLLIAALFNLLHRGNAAAHTAITLFGIAWGAACVRAGTLAPAIGAHVVHDTLEALLQPSGHPNQVNASTTWVEVVMLGVALSVWFAWLIWVTRKRSAAIPKQTLDPTPPSRSVCGQR